MLVRLGYTEDPNTTETSWLKIASCCVSIAGPQSPGLPEQPPFPALLLTLPEGRSFGKFPSAVQCAGLEMTCATFAWNLFARTRNTWSCTLMTRFWN